MKIPLHLRLKRKVHKDIAYAQDLIVEEVYRIFPRAVLHGGTAIWRCYNGNRFSEDLDFYFPKNESKLTLLFEELKKKGFEILKKRIKENSLFSVLKLGEAIVRLEAIFKMPTKSILKEFETTDGLLLTVYTFPPEQLVKEKVEAFLKRKKVRDLYDVFFLIRYSDKKKVAPALKKLLTNFEVPKDANSLSALLSSGAIPTIKKMYERIKEWVN